MKSAAIAPSHTNSSSARMALPTCLEATKNKFEMLAAETFATFTSVLPNAIRWVYRVYIAKEIIPHELKQTIDHVTRTATLYEHKSPHTDPHNVLDILHTHGDHAHPYSTLGLADKAQSKGLGRVFSLYLPYDDFKPTHHRALYAQAIDKIQSLVGENIFKGIAAVGHSKGAIESAYLALVNKEERIKALIAIGGRLRVTPSCEEELIESINKIYDAILKKPQIPLYVIAAEKDWCCIEPESTQVITGERCYVAPGARHLNVLFHEGALDHYVQYLRDAQSLYAVKRD